MAMRLTFFTKDDCELCDAAWFVIRKVVGDRPIEIDTIDIVAPEASKWHALYSEHIPVLHIDGKEFCRHRVIEKALRAALKGCD